MIGVTEQQSLRIVDFDQTLYILWPKNWPTLSLRANPLSTFVLQSAGM